MNTNIKNNKMGLGLSDKDAFYMIKYDTQAESPLRVQRINRDNSKEIFEFKVIRDAALFLKNDGFIGCKGVTDEECPQMLVNTFNTYGTIL